MTDVPPDDPYGQHEFTGARTQHRPVSELDVALSRWFRDGPPQEPAAAVSDVDVPAGGASSDLFLVRVTGLRGGDRRVAVRLEPSYAVYPVVDLEQQFRLARAASEHSRAPVPRPLWYEAEPRWLGSAFIVTAAAPGLVGGDVLGGWPLALSPDERRRLWERSIEALASLHACDLAAAGLHDGGLPVPGASALDRAIAYWETYLRFVSQGDEFPLLERAVARVRDERPDAVLPDALVWGDARLGNMLFVDNEPSALLDFEFCHVGLREFDVAFFSLFDEILAVHFMGAERLSGYPSHDESLDHYESVSGNPIRHRSYFTLMAGTYSALATTRVLQGRAAAGYVDPSLVHGHGPMKALAELLGASISEA